MEKIKRRQRLLSFLQGADGRFYYDGPIDGIDGPKTQEGAERFLEDYGFQAQAVTGELEPANTEGLSVMVFSLAEDGDKLLSPHFRVREFACNDGDVFHIRGITDFAWVSGKYIGQYSCWGVNRQSAEHRDESIFC